MKPKDCEKMLKLIVRFANERNAKRRLGLLKRLFDAAFVQHFFALKVEQGYLSGAVDEDAAVECQNALVKKLNHAADEGGFYVDMSININFSEKRSQPFMRFSSSEGQDVLVQLLAFLLFIVGFKGIRRCPGCAKFFVIKKHATQKACTDTCRQRVFQAKLSSKQKKEQRERRSDLYKAKNETGGEK